MIAAREISFLYAAVYGNAAAMKIAGTFGDLDLEFDALSHRGTALVLRGEVADGMRLLDEAATAATNGEVKDYLAIGEIYCKMLVCCELSLDVRRAEEWLAVAERFATRSHYLPVSAICHMHYGGILIAAGRWAEADTSLLSALAGHEEGYVAMRSGALVRPAGLRVRQGRLGEAERLVTGSEHDAYAVGPISLLHLARGEAELAAAVLRRHLREAGECVAVAEGFRALEIFNRLGAASQSDEAARRAAHARRASPARPPAGGVLTRRESEVLRLVVEGLSNEQIARRLYISKRTAEHHVSSLLAKLGAESRAHLIALGLRQR